MIGSNINRRTVQNVMEAGIHIDKVENLSGDCKVNFGQSMTRKRPIGEEICQSVLFLQQELIITDPWTYWLARVLDD